MENRVRRGARVRVAVAASFVLLTLALATFGWVWFRSHIGSADAPTRPPPEREVAGDKLASVVIPAKPGAKPLTIAADAFRAGDDIPFANTQYRTNTFPGLTWSEGPTATQSYVLIMQDPDMKMHGGPVLHWVMYNIPANVTKLAPGMTEPPIGASYGPNYMGPAHAYAGPRTPPGFKHRYHFQIFALDTVIAADPAMTYETLTTAMRGHVLAVGDIVGLGQIDRTAEPAAN